MAPEKDSRATGRRMCSDLIEVRFRDQAGRMIRDTGLIEDVSPTGLCVSLNLPVPVDYEVELVSEGFRGKAEVRYCNLGEYSYLLGLEFRDGYQWNQQKWRPKHLLILRDQEE